MNLITKLNSTELLHLLDNYSMYVTEFYDEHSSAEYPVCVYEFYDNEYQEIIKENNGSKNN